MTLRNKVASALSFAHLAGLGSRARAEDDKPADKEDEKSKKSKRADDENPDKKDQDHEDGDAKGSRAEDDDDDALAEDEDSDKDDDAEDDEDDKKAKKAKAKADDDDDDSEMRGNSAAAAARRRERARCASIFASKFAAKNPALAANLAFNTSMTRKEALVVLENTPSASSGYPDRQARNPNLGAGGASQPNLKQATTSSWDRAFAKANPRRGQSK
jgi:hypothetical protein